MLLLLAAFPLYYELGRNPVQIWDESRVAINAAEMAHNGNWMVPTYAGQPDHWNTKPPLIIWLEALSFRAFGYSTWALRLPVALANLVTVVSLFRFAARTLRIPLAGFFGGLVLVTCVGFVRLHVARTGEYDALLVCCQTLMWINLFRYLETSSKRYLIWLTVAFAAATLTKGPAGLLGLLGLLAYVIGRGKLWWIVRQPSIYLAALGWLVVVGGYFALRENVDPGYWQAVQDNDLGGRFTGEMGNHDAYWSYYLENIQDLTFIPWVWAVAPALVLGTLHTSSVVRRGVLLLTTFVIGWLLVVSLSRSQLPWYDAPIYPALALLVGIGLSILYHHLAAAYLPRLSTWQGWGLQAALLLYLFYVPYRTIMKQIVSERHSDYGVGPDAHLGRFVPNLYRAQPQLDSLTLLYQGGYNAVIDYYRFVYQQEQNKHLAAIPGKDVRNIKLGTVVVVCNPEYRARIDSTFQVVELHQDATCQAVLLLSPKK